MNNVSPLEHITPDSGAIAGQGVMIQDRSQIGKLLVEGESAEPILRAAFGAAPSQNTRVEIIDGVLIGRIRPNRYDLITPEGDESATIERISAAIGDSFITVSPQTDGQAMIQVTGTESRTLLSKLCGLDFDPAVFPVNSVKISSLAKIRVAIWHLEGGYQLYCGRSYADYLWTTIRQAGGEFEL